MEIERYVPKSTIEMLIEFSRDNWTCLKVKSEQIQEVWLVSPYIYQYRFSVTKACHGWERVFSKRTRSTLNIVGFGINWQFLQFPSIAKTWFNKTFWSGRRSSWLVLAYLLNDKREFISVYGAMLDLHEFSSGVKMNWECQSHSTVPLSHD